MDHEKIFQTWVKVTRNDYETFADLDERFEEGAQGKLSDDDYYQVKEDADSFEMFSLGYHNALGLTKVIISVEGGVVDSVHDEGGGSPPVTVEVRDYDIEGISPENSLNDEWGRYTVDVYNPQE